MELKRQIHERATTEVHSPLQDSLSCNLSSSKGYNFGISHLVLCWCSLRRRERRIWSYWKQIWESERYWNGERSEKKEREKTKKEKGWESVCEDLGKKWRGEREESIAELLPFFRSLSALANTKPIFFLRNRKRQKRSNGHNHRGANT